MDYEKKHKEAQKWIESIYSELSHEQQMEAEAFFPGLKESEDERMVKFIKNQLFNIKKTITDKYKLDTELTKAIDWLEKQGDRKIQSEDEKKIKKEIIDKVCKWLVKHWREYVWLTDNDIIHFGHWEHDLKRAME